MRLKRTANDIAIVRPAFGRKPLFCVGYARTGRLKRYKTSGVLNSAFSGTPPRAFDGQGRGVILHCYVEIIVLINNYTYVSGNENRRHYEIGPAHFVSPSLARNINYGRRRHGVNDF